MGLWFQRDAIGGAGGCNDKVMGSDSRARWVNVEGREASLMTAQLSGGQLSEDVTVKTNGRKRSQPLTA